jgi:hypothetical protein
MHFFFDTWLSWSTVSHIASVIHHRHLYVALDGTDNDNIYGYEIE